MDKLLSNFNIVLQRAELSSLGKEWKSYNNCDHFARVYYISAGSAQMQHGAMRYLLLPGHIYLIPPYFDFSYKCPEHVDIYWLHLTANVSNGRNLFSLFNWKYEVIPSNTDELVQMFKTIIHLNKTTGLQAELQLHGLLAEMIAFFICGDHSAGESAKPGMSRFLSVIDYINENLGADLPVDKLAAIVRLNRVRFTTEFHRLFGIPPAAYIRKHRIGKAQDLLLNSDWKLDRIASELGFCDSFHFSKTFNRMTGCSPSAYRSSIQRNTP
jgi:AraC-like DNA-binding protein